MQNNTFSTLFIGQNLIKLSSVDSTNNYLKKVASNSEPLPEGTVIMADNQFAGRGQQQNIWHAEAGKNLTFSIWLKPDCLLAGQHFVLNMLVCVALNNALAKYLPVDLTIKWPNDIYFKDHKIGGILIENAIMGNKIKNSIIGIGLNVNQRDFQHTMLGKAASIAQILQQDVNLMVLLNEICIQIEQLYLRVKTVGHDFLKELYTNKLYRLNQLAFYRDKDRVFEGKIEGISENGLLRIKPLDEECIEFSFKEVSFM